jgi:hypothetical protein
MENTKHETLEKEARRLLYEINDEIIAKRLQEEEEKELELLELSRIQEESESLELALNLQAKDYFNSKENNNAGKTILY